jgi:hypothetical protein
MLPKFGGLVPKYSAEWWSRFHSVDQESIKHEKHGAPSTAHTSSDELGRGKNQSDHFEKPHQHD